MKDLRKLEKRFRPEIEGLRIIAILLVVVYHIWLGRVSGGIDIFFLMAGFLMTLSLISRLERRGEIGLGNFLMGLGRRLLPQALTVIVFIIIAGYFILPSSQLENLRAHFIATVFYFENWRLAFDAIDYLAEGLQASPFQHFWSLAVQGQIYIIWPIIFTVGYYILTKVCKLPLRLAVLTMLAVVVTISLSYSIYKTNMNQPWAYFDTFARIWEFGIGGMMALIMPYIKLPKALSWVIGWIGLLIICLTGIVLQVSTVFPGYMALVPISGAFLVLIAADNYNKGVGQFLGLKSITALGGLSYGIYLWHWPLLRFYQIYFDVETVSLFPGLIMIIITIILAYMTTNFIEKPIRDKKLGKLKPVFYSGGLLIVATISITFSFIIDNQASMTNTQTIDKEDSVPQASITNTQTIDKEDPDPQASMINTQIIDKEYPGAHAMGDDVIVEEVESYLPSYSEVPSDFHSFYKDQECLARGKEEVLVCHYGVQDQPSHKIALVGGSHSGHWYPALEELAEEMNFEIVLYNHDACRFTGRADDKQNLKDVCYTWNENLIKELQNNPPDLVFTTGTIFGGATIPEGFKKIWSELEGYTTIFALRDTPRMVDVPAICLEKMDDPADCGVERAKALEMLVPIEEIPDLPSNVVFGDLTQYFCDDETCPAVIGNVVVYRDQHHLTTYYVKTLAPMLKPLLENALEVADESKKTVAVKQDQS